MTALNAEQAAELDAAGHLVHGVDAQGAYLGLVPRGSAQGQAGSEPPAQGDWRLQDGAWVRVATLQEARATAWEAVKDERARRLRGTFTSAGRVFDIDPTNITGAVLAAMLAQAAQQPFSQTWVLADNTTATLTGAEMIAAGMACAAAVDALWQTSVALRAQIDGAQTPEEALAITWPA